MFLQQVDTAVRVFECRFPDVTYIFLFDNAPSLRKYLPDGLNPTNMNVHPGENQAIMRDTVWDEKNGLIRWYSQGNEVGVTRARCRDEGNECGENA